MDLPSQALDLLRRIQPDPVNRRGAVFTFGNAAIGCDCSMCLSPAKRGQPIQDIRAAFATAAQRAGVRHLAAGRLRIHDIRHTTASWLLAATGDLVVVKAVLGHASIKTSARYAHLMSGRKAQAVEKISHFLGDAQEKTYASG